MKVHQKKNQKFQPVLDHLPLNFEDQIEYLEPNLIKQKILDPIFDHSEPIWFLASHFIPVASAIRSISYLS